MPKALPRVTYSNVSADFAGVHALLDARISTFCKEMLGWTWSNHVGGINEALGATYYAVSPIDTNVHLGSFHAADAAGVDRAVRSARAAFDYWGRLPWPERVTICRRFADELKARKYDLAVACLLEVGKSRMEAMGEAEEAIDLVRYYADEMEANEGYSRPLKRAFRQEATSDLLRPIGVFAVIAPFNFPLALSVNMITGALITGNTVAAFAPSVTT